MLPDGELPDAALLTDVRILGRCSSGSTTSSSRSRTRTPRRRSSSASSGWQPGGGGRHDRLGTFNRLVWLGDSYLELIGVFDRGSAASSWIGAPTLRALEAGGGLATWAIATRRSRRPTSRGCASGGAGLAEPVDGERARPDGRVVRWRLSARRSSDRDRPPFLIEHDPARPSGRRPTRASAPRTHPIGGASPRDLGCRRSRIGRRQSSCARSVVRFRPSLSGGGARDADIGDADGPAPPDARPHGRGRRSISGPDRTVGRRRRPRLPLDPAARRGRRPTASRADRYSVRPARLTSGTRRSASPGSARGAPPRCPSTGPAACRAGR